MPRPQSSTTAAPSVPRAGDAPDGGSIAATELKRPSFQETADPIMLDAGAEIFRRLERRPRRPKWMMPVTLGVLAAAAAGGVIAYQTLSKPGATAPTAQVEFITPGK